MIGSDFHQFQTVTVENLVESFHLRVFFGNRKLFDYYPLRMKVFDYRQWQQLTYPSMTDGTGKWETELDGIIRELMVQ